MSANHLMVLAGVTLAEANYIIDAYATTPVRLAYLMVNRFRDLPSLTEDLHFACNRQIAAIRPSLGCREIRVEEEIILVLSISGGRHTLLLI